MIEVVACIVCWILGFIVVYDSARLWTGFPYRRRPVVEQIGIVIHNIFVGVFLGVLTYFTVTGFSQ